MTAPSLRRPVEKAPTPTQEPGVRQGVSGERLRYCCWRMRGHTPYAVRVDFVVQAAGADLLAQVLTGASYFVLSGIALGRGDLTRSETLSLVSHLCPNAQITLKHRWTTSCKSFVSMVLLEPTIGIEPMTC